MSGVRSALIVASYEYEDPGLTRLRAPVQDAEALAAVLGDPEVGAFEIQTVLNEPAHTITRTMERFFADRGVDDLLLLHYSGHGVKDESGDLYFAAANTELEYLSATGVAADFVNRLMNRTRARRVLLLLDCCYAGAFEKGLGTRGDSNLHLEERLGGRGRAVITASTAMEYAFEGLDLNESQEGSPSVFTSALVQGLSSGDADRDQDGMIGLDELYEYVYDRVRQVTPNQTPSKWSLGMQGELYVARRCKPITTPSALPDDLKEAMDSSFPSIRSSAVSELGRLLRGRHAGLSLAARRGLEQLTGDDSRSVAAAASATLAAFPAQRTPELPEEFAATATPSRRVAASAPATETVHEPSTARKPEPPEKPSKRPSHAPSQKHEPEEKSHPEERIPPPPPIQPRPGVTSPPRPRTSSEDAVTTPPEPHRVRVSRRTVIIAAAVALVVAAAAGILYAMSTSGGTAALSDQQAVVTVGSSEGGSLQVVDVRTGQAHELVASDASRPTVSPNRRSIIYLLTTGDSAERTAHVIDADGGDDHVLYTGETCGRSTKPAWSPAGDQLAVICTGGSAPTLWTSDPDGGSLRQVNLDLGPSGVNGSLAASASWAPYGNVSGIVFPLRSNADGSIDLFWVDPADPSNWEQVTSTTGADYDPTWSHGAGRLLFQRNEAEQKAVGGEPETIESLEDGGNPVPLTGEGYSSGSWSPDGTEVVLTRTEDDTLMVVDGAGAEPQPVPDFSGDASSLAWSSR
jgi:uncharacterized caspase-like protein